jgi:hypothetical protein
VGSVGLMQRCFVWVLCPGEIETLFEKIHSAIINYFANLMHQR